MAAILTCPDEHELLAVATGEPAVEEIERHLDACPTCRARVERLRAELAALRLDLEGGVNPPSTEPDPAVNHDGEPPDGGSTFSWPADPTGDADAGPAGPEAVAAARARAEGRTERPGAIGRYLVVDQLDGGAQGQVFRVIHPNLGQDMVLKLGRQPVGADDRASLVAEGRLLADLEHINLVRIYDLDFHNHRPFLVMEYIHGRNLEDYARDEPVTPRRAAELVAKLAGALAMVHRRGIVHRDIKPRNILIDEAGEPRLIDFGLARLRHAWSDPFATTWGGTLAYMAPEQARLEHDRIGPRSDTFGLGAVLYFLLTGQAPFVGETQEEVWDRARRCDFEPRALRIARAPRRLERICLKAMAAEPADRYATAEAFQQALRRHLARPKVLAASGVVCAAILLGGGLYSFVSRTPTPTMRQQRADALPIPPVPDPHPIPTPGAHSIPTPAGRLKGRINLLVVKSKDGTRTRLRLDDPRVVPLKAADEFRIEARLDRPAYLYLFWIGSEGKVAPLYPWKENDWSQRPAEEQKVTGAELPKILDDVWEIPASPPGLETLVLLAREDSPLPHEDEARLAQGLSGPPVPMPPNSKKAVWIEDGEEVTFEPTAGLRKDRTGDEPSIRSIPSPTSRKSDDPVLRIRALLREKVQPLGGYSQAVVFPNHGGS